MPDIVTNVLYQEIDRLQEKVKELEAERDGYRNGQMQLQDTLSTVMDSNAKWAAENKRLCKRIAELEAENHRLIVQRDGAFERWKSATAKYPNGADGCCCLFDDNENQVQWCTPHAELRDENDALTAERDKLTARVKELEAENKRLQIEGRVE
jgi:predicted nuclease with TOPRIM domain